MKFSAKISSLIDKELSGTAQLEFFEALTMKSVDGLMKDKTKGQTPELRQVPDTSKPPVGILPKRWARLKSLRTMTE